MPHAPLAFFLFVAPLTFDEALSLASEAPLVAGARAAVAQRREGGATVSRLTGNPQFGLTPGARRHAEGWGPELHASLNQPLNVAGLGDARRAALASELSYEMQTQRSLLHSARLRAGRAWLALWAAQAAHAEARREHALASEWAERVARASLAGAMTKADAAAASAWVAEAALAALATEGEVYTSGVALNEALGLDGPEPSSAQGELPEPPLLDEADLTQSVERSVRAPAVAAAAGARDAETARLHEIKAANGAWLQVGLQAGREGAGDLVGLGTVQLTLPAFDRGEREQTRVRALAARAEGERRDALARARAERVLAHHEVEHTRETLALIEASLLPAAEDAARFAQRRMEGGETTAFEWVLARRTVLAAKSRRVRARADHTMARFAAAELATVTRETP